MSTGLGWTLGRLDALGPSDTLWPSGRATRARPHIVLYKPQKTRLHNLKLSLQALRGPMQLRDQVVRVAIK